MVKEKRTAPYRNIPLARLPSASILTVEGFKVKMGNNSYLHVFLSSILQTYVSDLCNSKWQCDTLSNVMEQTS